MTHNSVTDCIKQLRLNQIIEAIDSAGLSWDDLTLVIKCAERNQMRGLGDDNKKREEDF